MKKFLLIVALLFSLPAFADTIAYRDKSVTITSSQISTAATNSTNSIDLGAYRIGSVQCKWDSVNGTQPVFKLQVSNNGANWDDVSGASTTTTATSGSSTFLIDPLISRYARVNVSTASTTGTLDCVTIAN